MPALSHAAIPSAAQPPATGVRGRCPHERLEPRVFLHSATTQGRLQAPAEQARGGDEQSEHAARARAPLAMALLDSGDTAAARASSACRHNQRSPALPSERSGSAAAPGPRRCVSQAYVITVSAITEVSPVATGKARAALQAAAERANGQGRASGFAASKGVGGLGGEGESPDPPAPGVRGRRERPCAPGLWPGALLLVTERAAAGADLQPCRHSPSPSC